ncbi:MAG: PorT family protein [Thermoplasmata archaeon]|nr:MAG: PorT family protein [Thermoplasmata archaeon]
MSKRTKAIIKGSLLFFFLSFLFISEIHAQKIKLLGGNNFSRYTFSPDSYMGIDWDAGVEFRIKSNLKNGLLIGLGLEFSLNKYLGFEMDILYSQKGCRSQVYRADIPEQTTDYSLNTISLPLLLKIKLTPVSSPYILCGCECSYILSHDSKGTIENVAEPYFYDQDLMEQTSRSDFGYILGGGFEIKIHRITFFIEGRFSFGTKNIMSEPYPVDSISTKSEMLFFGFKL